MLQKQERLQLKADENNLQTGMVRNVMRPCYMSHSDETKRNSGAKLRIKKCRTGHDLQELTTRAWTSLIRNPAHQKKGIASASLMNQVR